MLSVCTLFENLIIKIERIVRFSLSYRLNFTISYFPMNSRYSLIVGISRNSKTSAIRTFMTILYIIFFFFRSRSEK